MLICIDAAYIIVYDTGTWKPVARVIGVPVVASSARKYACGAESAGLTCQVKLLGEEASTEVWLHTFYYILESREAIKEQMRSAFFS